MLAERAASEGPRSTRAVRINQAGHQTFYGQDKRLESSLAAALLKGCVNSLGKAYVIDKIMCGK
ncbi:MAG: hypothetical protein LZF86_190068 [Nitrospira sp.]|nr:MAG: hypothetical protein LZF86_190068 [Nitrospira sp.]